MGKKSKTVTPELVSEGGVEDDRSNILQTWWRLKCVYLAWIVAECRDIISSTEAILQVRRPKDCNKSCRGCKHVPNPLHFDGDEFKGQYSIWFPRYNIVNLCSFESIQYYCDHLQVFLEKIPIDNISPFLFHRIEWLCLMVSQETYTFAGMHIEALAKKESKRPGADAMKKRGSANKTAIVKIIDCLDIKSTSEFRKDKTLRSKFYTMAKKETDCASEDRIYKIAHSYLKGKSPV